MGINQHASVCINTRILSYPTTGVQRYLLELLQRMPFDHMQQISPQHPLSGARAHLWEQTVLPLRTRGHLLWSPGNTGPLAVRRQVVTIHDVVPLDHPEWLNPRFAAWYRFLTPRLVRRGSRMIADSEFTKTRLLERTGVAEGKVAVVMQRKEIT